MSSVEAQDKYEATSRVERVWLGGSILPVPSCALQLRSLTAYPTENRKANLRLAELAVCELLALRDLGAKHPRVPDCNAEGAQVCELEVSVPAPSSDEHQEPFIGAAVALAAYSKVCALFAPGREYECEVQRGDWAVASGLQLVGGVVKFRGLPSPGLLDLKLGDAFELALSEVILAAESRPVYEETEFYHTDVHSWPRAPPAISFCEDLACLVQGRAR